MAKRRLGKQDHKYDARTLMLVKFLLPDIRVPTKYDFDQNKVPIPLLMWGNDRWGDCVIAGEANHLLRLERVEQRRTVRMNDDTVVERYKALTGAQSPGDNNDQGLVVLDTMRDWRNAGWTINNRNYTIAAYGELEPNDRQQMRMAIYAMHGIHMGFSLPVATQRMRGTWDYTGQTGAEWQPGSWGGHLVYSKRFTPEGLEILTWGEKVFVTNAFIEKYCDEAWAVVDNLDSWRIKQTINVAKLSEELSQISQRVNQ